MEKFNSAKFCRFMKFNNEFEQEDIPNCNSDDIDICVKKCNTISINTEQFSLKNKFIYIKQVDSEDEAKNENAKKGGKIFGLQTGIIFLM